LHAAVIAPNCATSSCHSSLAKTAGLTLDDPEDSYRQLLGRNFVVPGDPASTLLSLLTGDERRRMPPDAPLPEADIALVRLWIDAGAPP
jgi:Planctomycete cytochrome C